MTAHSTLTYTGQRSTANAVSGTTANGSTYNRAGGDNSWANQESIARSAGDSRSSDFSRSFGQNFGVIAAAAAGACLAAAVGAGASAEAQPGSSPTTTNVGLDIDLDEMHGNRKLDEKIQCDVTQSIPVAPGSIDLFMVSSGIEHFKDNGAFLRNAFLALRPGGFLIAQFPGRYAPFAIVNRMLPKKAADSLMHVATSDDAGVLGFTYYDRTNRPLREPQHLKSAISEER